MSLPVGLSHPSAVYAPPLVAAVSRPQAAGETLEGHFLERRHCRVERVAKHKGVHECPKAGRSSRSVAFKVCDICFDDVEIERDEGFGRWGKLPLSSSSSSACARNLVCCAAIMFLCDIMPSTAPRNCPPSPSFFLPVHLNASFA